MDIKKIIIAGAGTMGSSMAQIFAGCGYQTTLYNHREETLNLAKRRIQENVAILTDQGEMTQEASESLFQHLAFTTDMESFGDCDLIVENVAENLDIKLGFYRRLSKQVNPQTIVATNTSGLSINRLAEAVDGKERFIGMHWFNPPHLVPLIEIIKGDQTKEEVAEAIYQLSLEIGKKPVMVNKDVPGFAANRIQFAVLRETLDLVQKGVVSVEGADDLMKYGLGFRYACLGPLEVADFGGLDTFYHIGEYLIPDLCNSREVPQLLKEHFKAGEYGVKNGAGFYGYQGDKAQQAQAERDEKYLKISHALYD